MFPVAKENVAVALYVLPHLDMIKALLFLINLELVVFNYNSSSTMS